MTSTMVGSALLTLGTQKTSSKPWVGGKWVSRYEGGLPGGSDAWAGSSNVSERVGQVEK